ncbi:hypothetical protein KUCAC02_026606, partial [Chaenocephalus aceratus]
ASSRALYCGVCPDSASVTPGPAEHPPEHCTAECVLTQLCDTWQCIASSRALYWECVLTQLVASSRALYCGVCPDSASVTWPCRASSRALYCGVCPDSASVTPGPAEHPPEHCTAECVLTQLCDTWPCRASSRALYCGVCPDSA